MAESTPAVSTGRGPLFALFLILWIGFALALTFNQAALDSIWTNFLGLPLVLQAIGWILFLPLMLGLWIWKSDWALWLRLLLIAAIAIGNLAAFSPLTQPRPAPAYRRTDRHEIPPGSIGV